MGLVQMGGGERIRGDSPDQEEEEEEKEEEEEEEGEEEYLRQRY